MGMVAGMNKHIIGTQVAIYKLFLERIMEEHLLEEDDQALRDTLDGELPLTDMIVELVRKAKRDEAFVDALHHIMMDNKVRKQRLERRADKLRELAAWAMQEIGLTRIEEADMTISQRQGQPPLVITAPASPIGPGLYVKETHKYEWDKAALREALSSDHIIAPDYATLGNPQPILTVRTK